MSARVFASAPHEPIPPRLTDRIAAALLRTAARLGTLAWARRDTPGPKSDRLSILDQVDVDPRTRRELGLTERPPLAPYERVHHLWFR